MAKAVDLVVTGRVQGVFFRARLQHECERLGVSGWVRNDPEGSVSAHLEGSPHAVDAAVSWCRTGPPHAEVEQVQVRESAPHGAQGFRVLG